jgi:PPM family protein phosphatase
VDELLPIGEFSVRCGLSPKVLRTYAAAGLMTPAAVDHASGYRYYAPGQVRQATLIADLRRAGVPLTRIQSFLAAPTTAILDQLERDLDAEVQRRRDALVAVRRQLAFPAHVSDRTTRGGQDMPTLTAGGTCDIGLVRPGNQDTFLIDDSNQLFVVADGMGRHGELASSLAAETLQARFTASPTIDGLVEACREANAAVWRRTSKRDKASGTTLAAIAVVADDDDPRLAIVHVGDSRAYRLHGGELSPLTEDHSVTGELVRAGELTDEAARSHPQRSLLTRALGIGPEADPEAGHVSCENGDRFLLCTDGLFNQLEDRRIRDVLLAESDPSAAASELTRLANLHGGQDNVAVIVIDAA